MNFSVRDVRIRDNRILQEELVKFFNDLVGAVNALDYANGLLLESSNELKEVNTANNLAGKFTRNCQEAVENVARLFKEVREFFEGVDKFQRTRVCKLVNLKRDYKANLPKNSNFVASPTEEEFVKIVDKYFKTLQAELESISRLWQDGNAKVFDNKLDAGVFDYFRKTKKYAVGLYNESVRRKNNTTVS